MSRSLRIALVFAAALVLVAGLARALNVPVLMRGYDLTRSGQTPNEDVLTTANVVDGGFGKLFDYAVDGQAYAQPLYVPDLAFPDGTHHNTLFVATMGNQVSALDADVPGAPALWTRSMGTPVSLAANPALGGACGGNFRDFIGTLGVTSTPTIDLATHTMYLVAMTEDTPQHFAHRVHALDLATGAEKLNGPVQIQGFFPGTGYQAKDGGFTFNSAYQNQRVSLVEANGRVYIAFAAFCDTRPYQGWVFGYSAADLSAPPAIFNDEPTGASYGGAGIWMSGAPPAVDDAGFVYLTTGNGDTSTPTGGKDFGETVLKLSPDLQPLDSFTPYNYAALNSGGQDLGITTFIFIPGTRLGLIGCKTGKVYVLDRTNLGGFHAGADTQIPQWFQASTAGHHIHGSPVLWNYPGGNRVFVWAENDRLRAYDFIADGAGGGIFDAGSPAAVGNLLLNNGMPGGMLSVSQNGPSADSAILWAATPIAGDANHATVAGRLLAYDARNLGEPIWNSDWNAVDQVGNFAKFVPPMITNGRVYLATFSSAVRVYGLLDSTFTTVDGPAQTLAQVPAGIEAQVQRYRDGGTPSGTVTFTDSTGNAYPVTLDDAGTARYQGQGLHPGSYTLTAAYAGNAPTLKSKSPTFQFAIIAQPTTTVMEAPPADARFGTAVPVTVHVLGAATRAQGLVMLLENDAGVGTAPLDDAGTATVSVSGLSAGVHTLTARFPGSTDFAPSASSAAALTLAKATSSLTFTTSPAAPEVKTPVTLRAQLGAGASGTVAFSSPDGPLGTGIVL